MQNKGAIRLLAILLTLVCIYQLSFTFKAAQVRNQAEEYANGDLQKEQLYLDSLAGQEVFNLGVKNFTFREVQENELNLGLDLKGGMNVILEISVADILRSLSNYSTDTTFNQAISLARERQTDSQEDFLTLFEQAFTDIDPNAKLAAVFNTLQLRDRVSFNSTNEEVMQVIRTEAKDAIDNAFNILRSRIDQFGVAQPNIQKLETTGRILVELPGIDNQERARRILQSSANLEFWETYQSFEIISLFDEANQTIKNYLEAQEALTKEKDTLPEPPTDGIQEDLAESDDIDVDSDTDQEEELSLLDELESDTVSAADTGATREEYFNNNPLYEVLTPYVTREGEAIPGAQVGVANKRDTADVNFYLQLCKEKNIFPRNVKFLWGAEPVDEAETMYGLYAIKVTTRDGRAPLEGDVITRAQQEFSQTSGEAKVTLSMNKEGTKTWARLTREASEKEPKGHIAIVLDNYVRSAPRVNGEITGGSTEISGDFTIEEASDLANILKSGKLPAPARIIQEEIVGPSLGQEAINSGLNSFLIAFLVVMFYMIFYYSRRAGLVADIALIANMFFLIGVLASLGATLTLPGIAGIVLTIGMSVDANVLIYERIREEIAAGKGIKMAIADGYKNAFSAILDANVTTGLTALILFLFGTGPIKGFATTLLIGIFTSLFSALFITRLIFLGMLDRNKVLTFATGLTENAWKNTAIKFLEKRKAFYVISALIVAAGIGSLVMKGLNTGVDFTGGRTFVVRFDKTVDVNDVENALADEFGHEPEVTIFGNDNQVRIVTKYRVDETGTEVDQEVEEKLFTGLLPLIDKDITMDTFMDEYRQSSLKVGPTIADDIKQKAMIAILVSLLAIFLYIFARFRNWQYGLGALLAVTHDTLVLLGLFSILYGIMPFSLEIDQAFIAAILTVIGYSINDTVVVFDRIREYIKLHPKQEINLTMNTALNSTLSRTFSTSLSTFFVLLAIFVFGGEVIRGFTFALLLGVVVGTYSSLFIATPIAYDTIKKKMAIQKKK
ncbi:MAG: protein translocase subunit SecDF [Bacteroidetes bacterium]|jgi:SecD/SecF fusion protein|nr:protein translocase subunit SecDF [Bacteroidota bacterium]